jgi:hypothetical protein
MIGKRHSERKVRYPNSASLAGGDDSRNDDDEQQDDDADNQTHAHLHVLPPHLLAYTVGSAAEALGRNCQVVGLVLERIEALATLGDLVDVIAHHTDGVVDLSLQSLRPRVAAGTLLRVGLATRDVGVIGGVLLRHLGERRLVVWFGIGRETAARSSRVLCTDEVELVGEWRLWVVRRASQFKVGMVVKFVLMGDDDE